MEFREFNVGDVVTVVNEPYEDCPFSWTTEMTRMCGAEVTIISKEYDKLYGTYAYRIRECRFAWCGNCFMPIEYDIGNDVEIEDAAFISAINLEV